MTTESFQALIRDVPDFPKPGILFRDITTLLQDPKGLQFVVDQLAERYAGAGITKILAIESRGFIFGAPLACAMGIGLSLVRKKGKLPYETYQHTYDLEYGSDTIEMHVDAVTKEDKVLIVDDLLATGGTAEATVALARKTGAEVAEIAFVVELEVLGGRDRLDVPVFALWGYGD